MVMVLILGMYIQYVPYYNPLICYMCTKKHKHIKRPKEVIILDNNKSYKKIIMYKCIYFCRR